MLVMLLSLALEGRDLAMAGQLVPGWSECKPVQPKVAAADFPKLDRALGISFEGFFKKSRVYEAAKSSGEAKETVRIVFVSALGGDLGIALDGENRLKEIAWFGEGSEPKPEGSWKKFLESFREKDVTRYRSSLELPLAEFHKKIEQAQRGNAPQVAEELRTYALLRQKIVMEDIEHSYLFLSDRLEKDEPDLLPAWEELSRSFDRLAANASALSGVLEEKAISRYKKNLEDSRAVMNQALAAFRKKQGVVAKRLLDEDFQDSCSRCHGWDGHSLRRPLQRVMRSLREELGIGDGFFRAGFDAPPASLGKEKDEAAMSLALRGALLLYFRSL